jgi:chaperone modulatory protein CbpM
MAKASNSSLSLVAFAEAGWLERGSEHGDDDLHRSRAQLIIELKQDLGVNDEAVPIILDLVDQLYGVRRALRLALAEARRGGGKSREGDGR